MKGESLERIREIRRNLEQASAKGSRLILANYVKREDLLISELVLESLRKLPSTGNIRRKKDVVVVQAVSLLVREIAESDSNRVEIMRLLEDALSRTPPQK